MIDIEEIIDTIDAIDKNENALEILLDFDGILDSSHVYAYENWIKGEIIKGPIITRHWVEVYLMYPEKNMPNPSGGLRLIKKGCHIRYYKDVLKTSMKIKSRSDLVPDENRPGKNRPKTKEIPVYVFKIIVPRHLFDTYSMLKSETLNQSVNIDDLVDAYDSGLDVSRNKEKK